MTRVRKKQEGRVAGQKGRWDLLRREKKRRRTGEGGKWEGGRG